MPPDTRPPQPTAIEDEDDNLDDLDDVLDQFHTSPTVPNAPPPTTTTSAFQPPGLGRPESEARAGPEAGLDLEEEGFKKLKAAWEAALLEGLDPRLDSESPTGTTEGGGGGGGGGGTYLDGLKQALDKIKEGESNLQSSSSGSGLGDSTLPPDLEGLLRSLSFGDVDGAGAAEGDDGDGGDRDEEEAEAKDIMGFLETVINQLMSKEMLYEPLKELSQGFPGYLANPPNPLSPSDVERFKKQQTCVRKVLDVFENPAYKDGHPEHSKAIVEFMSELQTYGSPPPEIMGQLPPGFEGFDKLGGGESCIIS